MNYTYQKNGTVEGFGLIKTAEKKLNVKGVPYLDLTICDRDGEINAKLWDYKEDVHGVYTVDSLIKFRGLISQFNGADQLRIDRIRPVVPSDGVNLSDYVPSAEYPGEMMYAEIMKTVSGIRDNDLKTLTSAILEEKKEKLLFWPAAFKLHHAMSGGLLYHTLSIVRMAESVCNIYPSIDKDLLLSGAILHDISKLEEFDVSETGIASGYSVKGNLLGHLVMGAMEVEKKAHELGTDPKKATLLEHMIISHHGEPEFGAAVRPLFIEAEILCQLDTLDATIYEMAQGISEISSDEFTQRMWALDNRKLYNHGRLEIKPKAKLD